MARDWTFLWTQEKGKSRRAEVDDELMECNSDEERRTPESLPPDTQSTPL